MAGSFRTIVFFVAVFGVWKLPAIGDSPTSAPSPAEGKHVGLAKAFLQKLANGEFAEAAASFDSTVAKLLPPSKLEQTWKQLNTAFGSFQDFKKSRVESAGNLQAVIITCKFERSLLEAKVVFDKEDRITGLWFAPPSPPVKYNWPRYVTSTSFQDEEVTIGTGEWALPGTLTMPKGEGPFPAVVLVHGSGPNDRDETIGPNKVFRDLAGGLATKGIAVLRYDKRTKVHGLKLAKQEQGITLKEETIDDAVIAVQFMTKRPRIDPANIYLLGHSLGSYAAPRIAKAAPDLAGLIVLAGSTRPMEDLIVEQYRYMALLDGTVDSASQDALDKVAEQAKRVPTLTADAKHENASLPLGVPQSYWLDMRGYDPVVTAQGLEIPMLFLQGGRDYQVTVADFDRWRVGLKGHTNVTFGWLPTLNHLFIAGKKKSTPAEYMQPGHVSPKVIEVIAEWIVKQSSLGG